MEHPRSVGFVLMAVGGFLVVAAGLILLGGLSWFRRLPGDIRIRGPHVHLFLPLTSMLLLSLLFTLIVNLARRLR